MGLAKHPAFRDTLRRFRGDAGNWISRSQGPERIERERVASALAVELSAATLDGAIEDFVETRRFVEWTCDRLERHPPSEFERMVHLAWMAILQGAGDYELLGTDDGPVKRPGHLDHSLQRFPSEERLRLGRLVARDELRTIASAPIWRGDLAAPPSGRGGAGAIAVVARWTFMTNRHQDIMDGLAALTGPLVRDEALLRRGVYQMLRRQSAEAALDLGQVASSSDKFVSFIANVALGALYYDSGDASAAAASYARAVSIVPATSARLGLATALLRSGEAREAAAVTAAMLRDERPVDPWRLYGLGLFHQLESYLASMRSALR